MCIYVWTKRQFLSLMAGVIILVILIAVSFNRYIAEKEAANTKAVAAFAAEAITVVTDDYVSPQVTNTKMTKPAFQVEVITPTALPEKQQKKILIYHTHTWEAYQQVASSPYQETEKWRTQDNNCNVVAVGAALAAQLRALGFTVVHDSTAYEPPNLDTSYARSLLMLEERTAMGESYDLYIDLHRDAISASSSIKRTVNISGIESARFMVLVGKGTGAGFDVKPDWEANLRYAQAITDSLNNQADGLCRDIKIKTGRFNQHIAPRCVLIECGNNLNTLEQTLNGIPYLAQAIASCLNAI